MLQRHEKFVYFIEMTQRGHNSLSSDHKWHAKWLVKKLNTLNPNSDNYSALMLQYVKEVIAHLKVRDDFSILVRGFKTQLDCFNPEKKATRDYPRFFKKNIELKPVPCQASALLPPPPPPPPRRAIPRSESLQFPVLYAPQARRAVGPISVSCPAALGGYRV